MHAITFGLVPFEGGSVDAVRIAIDDVDFAELVAAFEVDVAYEPAGGYGGLIPAYYRFGPLDRHFLGLAAGSGDIDSESTLTPVLGCECGEWGCWPLLAEITLWSDRVVWTRFANPTRPDSPYPGLGPFEFDRDQYLDALGSLRHE